MNKESLSKDRDQWCESSICGRFPTQMQIRFFSLLLVALYNPMTCLAISVSGAYPRSPFSALPVGLLCAEVRNKRIIPLTYPVTLCFDFFSISRTRTGGNFLCSDFGAGLATTERPSWRAMIVCNIARTPLTLQLYPPCFVRLAITCICDSALPIGRIPLVSIPASRSFVR